MCYIKNLALIQNIFSFGPQGLHVCHGQSFVKEEVTALRAADAALGHEVDNLLTGMDEEVTGGNLFSPSHSLYEFKKFKRKSEQKERSRPVCATWMARKRKPRQRPG